MSLEKDIALIAFLETGNDIEQGGLASTITTNQCCDLAFIYIQVHATEQVECLFLIIRKTHVYVLQL